MTDITRYIDTHLDEAIEQLRQYVALPSVAAQQQAIPETAEFVREMLESVGARAEVLPKEAPGNPVVLGELPGDSSRTLLLYNHYDVQPAELLELWTAPPFEQRRDGDLLYGRGISDNKGHLVSRLMAIRALQEANGGRLPVTIKFLVEGDEEIGSPKLHEFVEQHRERLAADVCLHEGGGVNASGRPVVSLGVKGILEVRDFVCGVRGYDYNRRLVFEPTCTINGIISGYTGPGMKTVLPSTAKAKLDFRLVPDQDPDDIADKVRKHLAAEGFDDVEVTLAEGEFPARSDANHPFVELVQRTAQEVYGQEPVVYPNMAGTQPLYPMMQLLGVPVASAGIGYPDARAHAPDENIRLSDFILGTKHVAAIIEGLGAGVGEPV